MATQLLGGYLPLSQWPFFKKVERAPLRTEMATSGPNSLPASIARGGLIDLYRRDNRFTQDSASAAGIAKPIDMLETRQLPIASTSRAVAPCVNSQTLCGKANLL